MKRLLLWLSLLQGCAFAQTVPELVEKNLVARGGAERIRAIQSLQMTGTCYSGGGDHQTELGYRLLLKRPGRSRREVTLQGLTAVTTCDGQEAWSLSPFGGRRDPEKMSAEDTADLLRQTDLDGPLLDWQAKGNRVSYLGRFDVEGTSTYRLRVELKNGDVEEICLDPDYYLEIRMLRKTRIRGVEREQEIDLGNYEKVDGVYFPFAVESGRPGQPRTTKILYTRAQANQPSDDGQFRMDKK